MQAKIKFHNLQSSLFSSICHYLIPHHSIIPSCHSNKQLTLSYFSAMTRHTLRLAVMAVVVSVAIIMTEGFIDWNYRPDCACYCRGDRCYNGCGTCNAFLRTGQSLTSRNGKAKVTMEADGNLVLYCTQPQRAIWASNTQENTNNVWTGARFQDDGNLVLYNKAGGVLWAASSNGGRMMIMQDDGNLAVKGYDGRTMWTTNTVGCDGRCSCGCKGHRCYNGCGHCDALLRTGQSLTSLSGKVEVIMQRDGNLVIRCTNRSRRLWALYHYGNRNKVLEGIKFQADGNLVLYGKNRSVLWAAGSNGAHMMIMQDDGSLAIKRSDGTTMWTTNTLAPDERVWRLC